MQVCWVTIKRILLTGTLTNLMKLMSVRFCFGLGREIYVLDAGYTRHDCLIHGCVRLSLKYDIVPSSPFYRRLNLHCEHCTSICWAMKIILLWNYFPILCYLDINILSHIHPFSFDTKRTILLNKLLYTKL